MKSRVWWPVLLAFFLVLTLQKAAFGQVITQSVFLSPGWNAVYLEVQPTPDDSASVFSGLSDVDQVWMWQPALSSVQELTSATDLVPGTPQWLVYIPAAKPNSGSTNLFHIYGSRCYLVHVAGASGVTWAVTGRPRYQANVWKDDSLSLVGFPVDAASPPTYSSFFASSTAHTGQPVYRLDSAGNWVKVASPASTKMKKGEAFWMYTQGHSTYQGPLRVSFDYGNGLDFGDRLTELKLTVYNDTNGSLPYTFSVSDAQPDVPAGLPAYAGPVPLSYWRQDYALAQTSCQNGQGVITDPDCWKQYVGWQDFSGSLPAVTVLANSSYSLRLSVRRNDMAAPAAKALQGAKDASTPSSPVYQSVLTVANATADGALTMSVPITAEGLQAEGVHPRAGLWVGSATVNEVSEHNPATDTVVGAGDVKQTVPGGNRLDPKPAAGQFTFRLIVHVDSNGTPRLLRQVTQVWKKGAPAAGSLTTAAADGTPGEYVLFSDNSYTAQTDLYDGVSYRDNDPVFRRITAPNFAFKQPLTAASGAFPLALNDAATVTFAVGLDFNDPLNPFRHKYHPDHDNLDNDGHPLLPGHEESYTVNRSISLIFGGSDPDNLSASLSGWGDSQLGGTYAEDLTGLHKDTLHVKGNFRLRRVSNIASLMP